MLLINTDNLHLPEHCDDCFLGYICNAKRFGDKTPKPKECPLKEVEKIDLAHTYQIPMESMLSENDIQEIIVNEFEHYITEKIKPNINTTEDTSRETARDRFFRNTRVFRSYFTFYIEKNNDFKANINIPMKVGIWNGQYSCPNCLRLFGNSKDILMRYTDLRYRCPDCGQALDWGEDE